MTGNMPGRAAQMEDTQAQPWRLESFPGGRRSLGDFEEQMEVNEGKGEEEVLQKGGTAWAKG